MSMFKPKDLPQDQNGTMEAGNQPKVPGIKDHQAAYRN